MVSPGVQRLTPKLAVNFTGLPSASSCNPAKRSRSRSAIPAACSSSIPSSNTTNSSPPRRPRTSFSAITSPAITRSTRSPTSWP